MTVTANSGPQINYGLVLSSSGVVNEYNEERGPSMNDLGDGVMDPRAPFSYKPGNAVGTKVYGWAGNFGGPVIDAYPTTINSSGIAATQSSTGATNGAAVTLTTSGASSNITSVTITPSSGGAPVTVLAIDMVQNSSLQTIGMPFGQMATINLWNPQAMIARALSVTTSSNLDTGLITVKGYDVYGFAMSEQIAMGSTGATNASSGCGNKAFKYIASATLPSSTTITSTAVSIGVADKYGFPIRIEHPGYISALWWGPSSGANLVNTSTAGNHVFASTVATATSTTGDVRGTWNSSNASNATQASSATANRLVIFASPTVAGLATISATNTWGLVGYPQA